jgi:hypothetical protein
LYKEYTKSLAKTYTILEEEFQKDTQPWIFQKYMKN